MASPIYMEWSILSSRIPDKLSREFKKRLIDDGVPQNGFIISCIDAYVKGEIKVEANPLLGGKQPSLVKTGDPDCYRVYLKDTGGALLNPLPITEKDL